MEMDCQPEKNNDALFLATRKCLFHLLSFLEDKLPEYCAIHSFVCFALTASNSSYRVYFRRRFSSTDTRATRDDFSIIIGIRIENVIGANQQIQKSWNLTAWTVDDEILSFAYGDIDVINWKKDRVVIHNKNHAPHPTLIKLLTSKHRKGLENENCFPIDQYVLPKNDALNLQLSLECSHAQMVYDNWPYNYSTTVEDVSDEIKLFPSAGVFLKENNELVSWMMCHPPTGMSRLYTVENHRRRGYAALVTQYLSKRVAQSGSLPFVNIVTDNDASYKFFENMGFQRDRPGYILISLPDPAC